MTRQDFLKAIQTGQLQGAYLLEGEEEALKQEALSLLRRAILPEGLEELNETVLTDPDTASIRAAAETMPFMAEHRLVIIRDCSAITGRKEADPALRDYLSAVPPSAVLVFIVTGKASGTKALVKALKKANHLVTFDRLKGDELNRWVLQGFEQA